MAFHRLTVPSYTGGLPGGYDYINNAVSGTPALADGAKAGGLNTGTYFVGLADDSTSETTNRPHNALAENCDHLDDLFHRDIAVKAVTAAVTAGGAVAVVTVAGVGQYFGESGTPNTVEGIATFCEVVDSSGDIIFGTNGLPCRVTSITGATVGAGFSGAASIDYNVVPSIPTGTSYKLVYSTRGDLAGLPLNAFSFFKRDGAAKSTHISTFAVTPSFGPFALVDDTLQNQLVALTAAVNTRYKTRSVGTTQSIDPGGVLDSVINFSHGGNITLTIPDPSTYPGREIIFTDSAGNLAPSIREVTLTCTGLINGLTDDYALFTIYDNRRMVSNGASWVI